MTFVTLDSSNCVHCVVAYSAQAAEEHFDARFNKRTGASPPSLITPPWPTWQLTPVGAVPVNRSALERGPFPRVT